jgi:LysM repeat protein
MSFRKGAKTRAPSILILSILVIASCTPIEETPSQTAMPVIPLTPYLTATSSPVVPRGTARLIVTPTIAPSPTPTPLTYAVVKDDLMGAIAARYGITLEELQAANPEVDPRLLSIGTKLIIPLGESSPPVFATATPMPVAVQPAECYSVLDGGAWCFILVTNNQARPLENLGASDGAL